MSKIKWPKGKSTAKFRNEVKASSPAISTKRLVSIDPASRSAGFAVYEAGELVSSGTIEMPAKDKISERLFGMYESVYDLVGEVDVIAIERIRGRMAHVYLTWAVGVIIAAMQADYLIEVPINCWKKLVGSKYEKTDENDAILIGATALRMAKDV